jgi:hypothetical protein
MRRGARASVALMVAAGLGVAGLGVAAEAPAHASAPGQTIFDNIRDSSTTVWQGWEPPVQPPGTIESIPDVSSDSAADSIHIDVVTSSGLYDIERYSNGTWSKWAQPPQPPATPATDPSNDSPNALATDPGGPYQIYSADTGSGAIYLFQIYNGWIYWTLRYHGGSWVKSWSKTVQAPANTATIAVTTAGPVTGSTQTLQILAMTSSGQLWHTLSSLGSSWQAWEQPAQLPDGAESIAAAGLTNGAAEFIAIAGNGEVYHTIRTVSGLWQKWEAPVQPPAGWNDPLEDPTISAAADYNDNTQFVIWDMNLLSGITDLYHIIRYANGYWQSSGWLSPWMPPGPCRGTITIPTFTSSDTNLHLDAFCYSGAG